MLGSTLLLLPSLLDLSDLLYENLDFVLLEFMLKDKLECQLIRLGFLLNVQCCFLGLIWTKAHDDLPDGFGGIE
jgi:hypothetical protein